MVFHVTWGDPGIDYLPITDVHEMDAALTRIADRAELPVMVFVDHEQAEPATQCRVLVGHPTRSSLRWTRYGTPPARYVASDPRLPLLGAPLVCDVEGEYRTLVPGHTRVTSATARRAVLDFVERDGARPNTAPLWTELTEPSCDGPYSEGSPPDVVCGLANDADTARLRRFARAVLSGHTAGHVMGSGVRLCRCGAVLEACRYRALARSHLSPTRPREDPPEGPLPQPAAPTALRTLAAGRPVRCRRRPGRPL